MNKNIQNLIDEYFEQNLEIKSLLYKRVRPLQQSFNFLCEEYILNETQHFLNKFDDFIENIIKNLQNFTSEYIYTGWNYNNKKLTIENLNNESEGFPIYVKTFSDNSFNIYAEVENRQEPYTPNDKIFINLNISKRLDSLFYKSSLKHELTHVVKMYSKDFYNNVNSKKDTIAIPDMEPFLRGVLYRYADLLYILSSTEQEAHINGTYEYIKNSPNEYKAEYKEIEKLIQDTFIFNRLDMFITNMNSLYDDYSNGRFKFILGIGHYMKKHHIFYDTTKYLFKEFLFRYYDGKPLDKKEKDFMMDLSDNIISCLQRILLDYKKRLFNAVYNILSEKLGKEM